MTTPRFYPMEIQLPSTLLEISRIFEESRNELYLVGGAVRDAVMGDKPKDFDVATNALPDQVIALFESRKEYKILEIGKSFGVVKLVCLPSMEEYEVATFRSDVGEGRRPESVVFTSIDQDVLRRDLTINALFYNIQTKEVVDYVGGMGDIQDGWIRTVGNPEDRFREDRLRVLRALRFAGKYKSSIAIDIVKEIQRDNSLVGVSPERIREELIKGIKGSREPMDFLVYFYMFFLWPEVFPGLKVSVVSNKGSSNVPVRLAQLLLENDTKTLGKVLNQLKYSAEEVSQVVFLVSLQSLSVETAFRLKKSFKHSHLMEWDLREFNLMAKKVDPVLLETFIQYQPSVTGEELILEGFSGKALGEEQVRRETELFRSLLG